VSRYIKDLIINGEGQHLDFKFEINDARKIARTLVAFSNNGGGKLLIGVKDNGKIAGVRSDEEYFMLEAASSIYCKPVVKYSSRKWVIEGKTVLEIDIPAGGEKPYLAQRNDNRWLAYLRVKDEDILVNSIQLRVWKIEQKPRGIFIEFTKNEKILLDYLASNEMISLSAFCRSAGISYNKASDILVRLIGLKVVEIVYGEKGILYRKAEKGGGG
jgi:predicted HTH transcriptional regulator